MSNQTRAHDSAGTAVIVGLSKREYFAALAMQGLIYRPFQAEEIAQAAVEMADVLIAELNKLQKE